MDGNLGKIKVFPHHFEASMPSEECLQTRNSSILAPWNESHSRLWTGRRLMTAASMLKFFSLPNLPWASRTNNDDKVELTVAEVESLRSEIVDAEEREAHLKAQLEHLDELLRSARLAGYLHLRTRWTELPGEPPIIEDIDVDDWLPRFVVLHGSCIYYYLQSTELSPQDSTLLSDVVEVGLLPSFMHEGQQTRHAFYMLTCHGLRFECASPSKIQVDLWLTTVKMDCNLGSDTTPKDLIKS